MGCGGCGGREGTLTLPPAHRPWPFAGLRPLIWVALLQGPASASCSAKTSPPGWLLATGQGQHPQGPGKGWVMLGWGLAGRGGFWVSLPSSTSLCCSH